VPTTVLVNPLIEPLSDERADDWEGCLSVPGMRGQVSRYTHIRYSGFDPFGARIEREVRDFHARVVQHECDHLDGVLYRCASPICAASASSKNCSERRRRARKTLSYFRSMTSGRSEPRPQTSPVPDYHPEKHAVPRGSRRFGNQLMSVCRLVMFAAGRLILAALGTGAAASFAVVAGFAAVPSTLLSGIFYRWDLVGWAWL